MRKFVRHMRQVQEKEGSRAATMFYIQQVGIYPLEIYNESYYADVVNYDLGMLMAHSGMPEEASDLLGKTGLLPAHGGNLLFSDHQRIGLDLYHQQQEAAKRGMASIIITSLPKSGSASLTQSLSEIMGSPVLRLSAGRTTHYWLVQAWVDRFRSGGLLTHDHFHAAPHNLKALKNAGVDRIVVQLRDPRASTLSQVNMNRAQRDSFFRRNPTLTNAYKEIFLPHVEWLNGWIEAAENNPWLSIHWVKFQDFSKDPWNVFAKIIEPLATSWPMQEIAARIDNKQGTLVTANFNSGDDNAWRKNAPPSLQKKMWKAIPKKVIDFLELEP